VDLGLLPRGVADSLAMHHYREFYMHGTGHWLGMDVHDVGDYKIDLKSRALEPGMVFTVEPGLYRPGDIGVRIEDDVLATPGGAESLTGFDRALTLIG
jgi:Xaa-Pro aminopeptidase